MINNDNIKGAMTIKLDDELPPMPKFVEGIRRAPKRSLIYQKEKRKLH